MPINRLIVWGLGVLCLAAGGIMFYGAVTNHNGLFETGTEMMKLTWTTTVGALASQIRV